MTPLLSVAMPTYKHEKFIAQAVQSALMQQTDFEIEIVIGEDCGSDRTREIIVALQQAHPAKIRLLLHEQNQGLLGKNNTVQIFNACRGKYIAFLEGDDYWTVPYKLQRQVDYLEQHPNIVASAHDICVVDENGAQTAASYAQPNHKINITLTDLLWANWAPSMSTVFRRGLFGDFPAWFYELRMTDWPLAILNAQFGDIHYMPEVMAAYRVHSGGIWSPLAASETELQHLKLLDKVNEYFGGRYALLIERINPFRHYNLAKIYARSGNRAKARAHAAQCWAAWRAGHFGLANALKAGIFGLMVNG